MAILKSSEERGNRAAALPAWLRGHWLASRAAAGPGPRRLRYSAALACALLVAGALEASSASGPAAGSPAEPSGTTNGGAEVEGSFDVATVEDLALYFATESVRKLHIPLLMRLTNVGKDRWSKKEEIASIRADPPKMNTSGVVYPFGDKNPLSFVFDPETRTLSCWERIVKKRGKVGLLGLTGPEMAAALNAASSPKNRGGADFAYDPIRDALSLRRDFVHPPASRSRFYKDIDTLVSTGLKWVEGRYIKKAIAIKESRFPPSSATSSKHGFAATVVLRHFAATPSESLFWTDRYLRTWDRRPGGMEPSLVSDREVTVDQLVHAFIHFRGAENNAHGTGSVTATIELFAANGELVFTRSEVPIWRDQVPPKDHLQLGATDISFALDKDNPTGSYRLEAEVCNDSKGRCVKLAHAFDLRSK